MDDNHGDRHTLRQLAKEMNATVDKRWREWIKRQMARFEEMIRGLVDAQVRGAHVKASHPEGSGEGRAWW